MQTAATAQAKAPVASQMALAYFTAGSVTPVRFALSQSPALWSLLSLIVRLFRIDTLQRKRPGRVNRVTERALPGSFFR